MKFNNSQFGEWYSIRMALTKALVQGTGAMVVSHGRGCLIASVIFHRPPIATTVTLKTICLVDRHRSGSAVHWPSWKVCVAFLYLLLGRARKCKVDILRQSFSGSMNFILVSDFQKYLTLNYDTSQYFTVQHLIVLYSTSQYSIILYNSP